MLSINYKPLWKLLIENDMNKTNLREAADISMSTVAKMGRNEYVALEVLERICKVFDCQFSDIVEYVPDEKKEE